MLAVRVPRPPLGRAEWFTWLVEPPENTSEGCTWYLDGSMLDGEWFDFRAVGFAIVVVSATQDLLAYGHGCPPLWCNTAAAAEAWALATTLRLCPFPPHMRTDCLALLHTAQGGLGRATSAKRPLARLWSQIGTSMDGSISELVDQGLLVWMPSHQTTASIGKRDLSNGEKLSVVDWRANRLVDALAKLAAARRRAPMAVTRLLASTNAAVKHAAKLLGCVTHQANNFKDEVVLPSGLRVQQTRRDAQPHTGQRRQAGSRRRQPQGPPLQVLHEIPVEVSSRIHECGRKRTIEQVPPQSYKRAKLARAERARSKAAEEAHTQWIVEETGNRLIIPAHRVPTKIWLQNILHRIKFHIHSI